MADERIDIEITDKVAPTIEKKIDAIAASAERGYSAIERLKAQLSSLNSSPLSQLTRAIETSSNATLKNSLLQQKLATEVQRTGAAFMKAEAATLRAVKAETEAAAAAQKLAAAQQQAQRATLAAEAAKARLAAQTERTATAAKRSAEIHGQVVGILGKVENQTKLTRNQMLTLQYTFNDVVASLASGASPMTILLQQGGQVTQAFGGMRGAVTALTGALSAKALVIGSVITATAGWLLVMNAANKEIDQLNGQLRITGNYAGITAGQYIEMGNAIAGETNSSIAASREMVAELAKSGKFQKDQIKELGASALLLSSYTGKSANEIVESFKKAAEGPTAYANELNNQFHFLSSAQLAHIRELEETGNKSKALAELSKSLYEYLGKNGPQNLGYLESAWRSVSNAISDAWTKLKDWGREETPEERVATLNKQFDAINKKIEEQTRFYRNGLPTHVQILIQQLEKQKQTIQGQLTAEKERVDNAQKLAKQQAENAKIQKEGADASTRIANGWNDLADNAAKANREITAFRADIDKALKANPNDKEALKALQNQAAIEKKIRERNMPQSNEAYQARLAALDQALKLEKLRYEQQNTDLESIFKQGLVGQQKYTLDRLTLKLSELDANKRIVEQQLALANNKGDLVGRARYNAELQTLEQQRKNLIAGTNNEIAELLAADEAKTRDEVAKSIVAINDQVKSVQDKIDAFDKLPSVITAAAIAEEQLRLKEVEQFEGSELVVEGINQKIAALERLKAVQEQSQFQDLFGDSAKQAAEAWKTAGETIGTALSDGFGRSGAALGKLIEGMDSYQERQRLIAEEAKKQKASGVSAVKAEADAQQKSAALQINAYGNIAGAAKTFFKEGSKGYKALQAAEMAFRAVEISMALQAMYTKLTATETTTTAKVTALATEGAAETASVGTTVKAEGAKASASGVAAFAKTLASLPFPFNVAAGAAVMALLVGAGVKMMGGGGAKVSIAEQRQRSQGTGTVLGDDSKKSESIKRAIEHLSENSNVALKHSQGMLSALKNIEASIGGLAVMVVRASGLRGTGADVRNLNLKAPSNFLSSLLGGKTQTLIDSGISISKQNLGEAIRNGIQARSYAEIESVRKVAGITVSRKKKVRYGDLDQDVNNQFGLVLKDIVEGVVSAGEALGRSGQTIRNDLNALTISLREVSFKDLSVDDAQKELEALFSSIGDQITQTALGGLGLEAFRKVGEGMLETAIRVATGMERANFELERLGITAVSYTRIQRKQGDVATEIIRESIVANESFRRAMTETEKSLEYVALAFLGFSSDGINEILRTATVVARTGIGEIIDAFEGSAEELVDLYQQLINVRKLMTATGLDGDLTRDVIRGAGSLENLSASIETFFEEFFTDEQQLATKTQNLRAQFEALGFAMPSSRDVFRDMVKGIDRSTESGQRLFGRLISLSEAFDEVQDSIEEINERLIEEARNALQERFDRAESAASDAMKILENAIQGEKDQAKAAFDARIAILDAQKAAAKTLFDEQKTALNESIKTASDTVGKIGRLSDALRNSLNNLQLQGNQTAYRREAQAQISAALATAKATGMLPDADTLQDALRTVAEPNTKAFRTFEDYATDFFKTANDINELSSITDVKKSAEERSLELLKDQLETLEKNYEAQVKGFDDAKEQAKQLYDAEISRLDGILKAQQYALAEANGTKLAVMSVEQAIINLGGKLGELAAARAAVSTGTSSAPNSGAAAVSTGTSSAPNSGAAAVIINAYNQYLHRDPETAGFNYWTNNVQNGASLSSVVGNIQNSNEAKVQGLYSSILNRVGEAEEINYWTNRLNNGATVDQVRQEFLGSAEYLSMHGSHLSGLYRVPFDGYRAVLHKDERVLNSNEAAEYNNKEKQQNYENLCEKVDNLYDATAVLVSHVNKQAKIIDRWETVGMPPTRTA